MCIRDSTYTATTFDELFDGVYSIHWEELLPADAAFPVTGSSLNLSLIHICGWPAPSSAGTARQKGEKLND